MGPEVVAFVCMYVCMCVYVCVCMHVYLCMYVLRLEQQMVTL